MNRQPFPLPGDLVLASATDAPAGTTPSGPSGQPPPAAPPEHRRKDMTGPLVFGVILIVVGAYFLVRQFIPQIDLSVVWPSVAIVAGVLLVVAAFVRPGNRR